MLLILERLLRFMLTDDLKSLTIEFCYKTSKGNKQGSYNVLKYEAEKR